jgi:hypothetical protein
VSCILKTLRSDTPLHSEVLGTIDRQALINTPTHGTVVDDDVFGIHTTESVSFVICHILVAQSETNITDNDILARNGERIIGNANAIARSRLSCNGDIWSAEFQLTGKMDSSRHIEHNGTCTTLIASIAERAFRVGVLQGGYMIDRTTTSTRGIASEAFCTRESQLLGMECGKRKEGKDECEIKKNLPFHKNGIGLW